MQQERQTRRVRLATTNGSIDGTLLVSPVLRTLDELNVVSRSYVTVHDPEVEGTDWFRKEPLCVRRSSILFVRELANPPARSKKVAAGAYARASLRLRLGVWSVEGFVHVPPNGAALKRLQHHDKHPFISLTSVSALGPDSQFAAPFLAINLEHVQVAQELTTVGSDEKKEVELSFQVSE